MAKNLVLPRVHAMVLCDSINERQEETDLFDLIGARTQILSDRFPFRHPDLAVYLQLTGHEGTADGQLKVVQARTDNVLFVRDLPALEFIGPQVITCVRARIRNCRFPEPGLYFIQFLTDDKQIGEKLLRVLHI
jgi:hypothetical protein